MVDPNGEHLVQLFVFLGPLALVERGAGPRPVEAVSAAGALTRNDAPPALPSHGPPPRPPPRLSPGDRVFLCVKWASVPR
ncbi:MAG: hypothetical protein IPO67_16575 [Deltaproteobacteria bacterium]|nr:hypothetical protein [Deltaproteobacteria bacterium]